MKFTRNLQEWIFNDYGYNNNFIHYANKSLFSKPVLKESDPMVKINCLF